MFFPIRPSQQPGALGEDLGFASPADSPVPLCGDRDISDPEDDTDEEEDGSCIRIGKGNSDSAEPTPEMINRHNLAHLPYRSLCPPCVAARRSNASHRSESTVRQKFLFCADYRSISDSRTEDSLTTFVGRMYPPKVDAPFEVVCERKVAQDDYSVSRLC